MRSKLGEFTADRLLGASLGARVQVILAFGLVVLITAVIGAPLSRPADRLDAASLQSPRIVRPALSPQSPSRKLSEDLREPAEQRFTGRVGPNLSSSLKAAGLPDRQGREYVALLARTISLANGLSVDDRFDVVLERNGDGSLGQLVYAGLDRVARADLELLKWTDGRQVIWVNADGVAGEIAGKMMRPVAGRVSSPFGERFHPMLGYFRMHKGVDLAAAYGSPIVAAADGRVVSAGWHGGYGNQVAIAHGDGMKTTYGHMSRIAAYQGETVRRGQVIGYVGSTGLSSGPHLHFEVMKNGRVMNPLSSRLANGPATLQGERLALFHDELRQVLLLPAA